MKWEGYPSTSGPLTVVIMSIFEGKLTLMNSYSRSYIKETTCRSDAESEITAIYYPMKNPLIANVSHSVPHQIDLDVPFNSSFHIISLKIRNLHMITMRLYNISFLFHPSLLHPFLFSCFFTICFCLILHFCRHWAVVSMQTPFLVTHPFS